MSNFVIDINNEDDNLNSSLSMNVPIITQKNTPEDSDDMMVFQNVHCTLGRFGPNNIKENILFGPNTNLVLTKRTAKEDLDHPINNSINSENDKNQNPNCDLTEKKIPVLDLLSLKASDESLTVRLDFYEADESPCSDDHHDDVTIENKSKSSQHSCVQLHENNDTHDKDVVTPIDAVNIDDHL